MSGLEVAHESTEVSEEAALASESVERKVQFFRLVAHERDRVADSPKVNWLARLSDACAQEPPAREFTDERKQTFAFDRRKEHTVAIAKRVTGSPVQIVEGQTIRPLKIAEVDAYLAFTTYAYLYPFNAFGILAGMPGVPRASAVAKLADHLRPIPDGGHWKAVPLTAPGQLERFSKAKGGVRKLAVKANVMPGHLLSRDLDAGSVYDYMRALSAAVGSELAVEMVIRVKNPSKRRVSMQILRNLIKPEELSAAASKLQVTTEEQEMLDLMEHNVAVSFDLPVLGGGVDLGLLVEAFETVGGKMYDQIQEAAIAAEA